MPENSMLVFCFVWLNYAILSSQMTKNQTPTEFRVDVSKKTPPDQEHFSQRSVGLISLLSRHTLGRDCMQRFRLTCIAVCIFVLTIYDIKLISCSSTSDYDLKLNNGNTNNDRFVQLIQTLTR